MVIESTLSRADFFRIYLWRLYLQRAWFYFLLVAELLVTSEAIIFGLYWLLLMWIFLVILVAGGLLAVLQALCSRKNAIFYTPCRRTFSDEGIFTEFQEQRGMVRWDTFVGWRKAVGYYLLFVTPASFVAIPQTLISADNVNGFESLLTANIKRKEFRFRGGLM